MAGGVGIAVAVVRALHQRGRDRRHGDLLAVDRSGHGATVVSEEHRIIGRPDAIRRLSDGRAVPIEIKQRATPRGGPTRSLRIQVAAYCLALESMTGRPPPYGLLRYSDGGEFRILWDASARAELLAVRAAIDRPYRGEATPSPGRCARCPWRGGCDARA
ncbi:MAG: PD-(D/E)XK nuclease family protein, partial [Thermoplasmata archaeon]|nr:PD-(D/E)XK nuclease family protein [Thermoplasmata archaeon]